MIFKTCKLYEKVMTVDDFGFSGEQYAFIADIEMCISISKFNAVENGVVYHLFETVGVTPFNNLELNKSYKIVDGDIEYICDSFLPARLSTLTLKRLN